MLFTLSTLTYSFFFLFIYFASFIRYALEMNVEKAQDVLMHKRLQNMARTIATRPAIEVRALQVTIIPI